MSKRAEELAKQLYPDPKLEDYDDILVYRTDRDNAVMGRVNVMHVYEQAEKDLKDELIKWATDAYVYENASAIRKVCYKQLLEKLMEL